MGQNQIVSYSSARAKYLNLLVSGALMPFEYGQELLASRRDGPICFIVGPPRSGTTLLYELVVTHFECGYFTNLAKRLFRVPVAATWYCRRAMKDRCGSFDSKFGELEGQAAPCEAGRIWRYWMPYAAPYCVDLPGVKPERVRRKIAAICQMTGAPMIVKNPILQSDMPLILKSFPNAVFVYIERDWADNARSLMGLREKRKPDDDTGWVSLRPNGWQDYAKADALMQSCAQVMLSHKDIEHHLDAFGHPERVMKINYEQLCAAPNDALDKIEAFFHGNGIAVARKPQSGATPQLVTRRQPEDETQVRILACLEEISK